MYLFPGNDQKPASSRNLDDIMKSIADWKSKTHLNNIGDEDNDENNIRSTSNFLNGGSGLSLGESKFGGSSNRLYTTGTKLTTLGSNGANPSNTEPENTIKAEKYLDIVKDLKKKYTRSRTEVSLDLKSFFNKIQMFLNLTSSYVLQFLLL